MPRLPLIAGLHITDYADGAITNYETGMKNVVVVNKNGRMVARQRPAINIIDAAAFKAASRGVYYWNSPNGPATPALYIFIGDRLYKDKYNLTVPFTPLATLYVGFKKVHWEVCGAYLVIIDPENDTGWTIDTSDTVAEITDVDFPATVANGAANLNGTLYVLDEDGVIYGSDIDDPTSWAALNFIDAERNPDGGSYIGKHHDNVVVIGPRSIEFFYDNANTTGSPLSRREGIAYQTGCQDGYTAAQDGDRVFFVGSSPTGELGVYMIDNFSLVRISSDSIDGYLTQVLKKEGYEAVAACIPMHGRTFYTLTIVYPLVNNFVQPKQTIAFDTLSNLWVMLSTTEYTGTYYGNYWTSSRNTFCVIGWTVQDGVDGKFGIGMLDTTELFVFIENQSRDVTLGDYVKDDYVALGYISIETTGGTAIPVTIRTGQQDYGSNEYKYEDSLEIVGNKITTSQNVTIKHAESNNESFSTGRTIDVGSNKRKIRRNGRFVRRNYELTHSLTEIYEPESLDIKIRQ